MAQATLIIHTKPHPKGRPRFRVYGNKQVAAYTPKSTVDAENVVRQAWEAAGLPCFEGPVTVRLAFFKDRIEVLVMENNRKRTLRGDLDNYEKTVLDGLNGVAYKDDKQISELIAWDGVPE
jgi:Holliday junction resolvase RusA-like endonuclease